jgi:F0F1-type ATP synthase assembly protein I
MDDQHFRKELAELKKRELELERSVKTENQGNGEPQSTSRVMRYAGLGLEFAAVFFGFVWAGRYLDERLGSKPWLVLLGICLGFGIALYRLIFVAKKLGE